MHRLTAFLKPLLLALLCIATFLEYLHNSFIAFWPLYGFHAGWNKDDLMVKDYIHPGWSWVCSGVAACLQNHCCSPLWLLDDRGLFYASAIIAPCGGLWLPTPTIKNFDGETFWTQAHMVCCFPSRWWSRFSVFSLHPSSSINFLSNFFPVHQSWLFWFQ